MTHTSSSIYTIDVGPRLLDGNREISLLYDGTPFFCATHRDVQWAFVASFYAPGDTANDASYVTVPDGSGIPNLVPVSADPGRELPVPAKTTPQEYLCVFHREELKDSNDRYVFSQPNTLCTSYTVRDGTSDHFVLHNISPTNITPGRHGVFIFGMRQTTRWGHASPLEIDGEVFQPAADTWWMASPLVVKPVYVQVPHGTVIGAASASLTGFSAAAGPPLSTDLQSPPSSPCPGSGSGFNFSRCALIDAQVLHQFPAFYDNRYLTVLLTGAEELGLAVTKAWNELDILTWYWTPHRIRIPDLPVCNSFLTVTVSEHPSLQEQVIFLYDSQHVKIHVIRIPNLQSRESKMELLFTFPCGNSPTVLPCARPSTPQLILVANYPVDGSVALFDPAALLSTPRADNYIATLPLAICVEAQKQVMEYETPGSGSDGSQPSTPQSTVLLKPLQQRRIEGIAFQEGSTVLYNYQSCASSNASRSREQGATGGRRRCEVSLDAATSFPSLQAQQDPLLDVTLEALEVAIGSWYVHKLEYTLLHLAWEAKKKGQSYSFTAMLCEVLVESVKAGVQGDAENGKSDGATAVPRRTSRTDRLWAQFTDPFTLTATSVEELATSLDDDVRGGAVFVPAATHKFKWPLHVCGICLVTLHILYESCKLQERYWPLLETLASLIEKVSILLGWRSYASVYGVYTVSGRSAGVLNSSASRTLRDTLSEEQLLQVYKLYETHSSGDESPHPVILTSISQEGHVPTTPFLLDGTPPSLGAALRLLLQREGISASAFPSLKQPRKALWPILEGLTPNHPITVANRVYLLYRDCFDPLFARDGTATAASTGKEMPWWQRVCHATVRHKLSTSLIHQDLNVGVAYPIQLALLKGKDTPGDDWSDALFAAVGRLDLVTSRACLAALSNTGNDVLCVAEEQAIGREYRATCEEDDGVLMRPDFPQTWKDGRLDVVQAYFNTTAPITLPTQSHPRDILKELAKRACAFSIGRGMFTLCTHNFKVRDSIPIPKLNLDGRTSDGIVVTNNFKEFHEENMMWPLFHNGCAAGLRFLPLHSGNLRQSGGAVPKDSIITRHWVVYQTQRSVLCPASRAGLLLAAGILGHLKVLQLTDIYSLLATPQLHYAWREATTMAVMLGLSCSFRSTNNDLVFRCLSMHVQSLTPNAEEIEVSRDVQTVALVSIGLLCQQTPTNGFLVEMLLSEMSRLPSDEHCMNREGYALGAGFGLGLLLLGLGDAHGIPNVEGRLLSFMDGARREPVPCAREGVDTFSEINVDAGHFLTRALFMQAVKESSKCVCTRVYEGHCYNIAVSGPAAVVALGLMYLKTNNESICRRLLPPNRYCEMQALSPSLCLLRTMMVSLVMWSSLFPTRDSLYRFVPSCLVSLTPKHGRTLGLAQQQVQYLMMNLGHCIAGAALALGFRYAGSMDADAREVIVAELKGFLNGKIGSTGIQVSALQRSTGDFEACVSSCCVAASLLVAGSGDMKIFSVLQQVEKRPNNSYGLQMALSMSFGLLFLGGGRLTVSTATPDVAALIIALHPVWPKDTEDNVHHLQALRHLYGLAVVPRIIETVDAVSNRPVSVPVRVILRKGRVMPESLSGKHSWTPLPIGKEEQEVRLQTPCLYPPSDMIERIEVRSTAHYPRVVQQRLGEIHEEGLSIRVLEKPSTSRAIVPGETADKKLWKVGTLNMSERRLHHWLHRVFSRHTREVCETLAILDSVKLLVSAQRQLAADTMDSEEITSSDFGRAVELTLHRRYQQIFMHGPTLTHTTHPLHKLLIKLEPWRAVVQEMAEAPAGTEGFPFDFTTLAVSTHVDEEEIHRWFAESLYFLLDWSGAEDTAQLSELLRSFARGLQDPSTRMIALLQMNSHVLLPLATLEQLVKCCMGG